VKSPRRVLLFSLALFMPFDISKTIVSNSTLNLPMASATVRLTDVLAAILLLGIMARTATDYKFKVHFVKSTTLPALVWLIAGCLSLVNAKDLQVSMIALISITKGFILYLVVANSVEDSQEIKLLIGGVLLSLTFEALLGSYQGLTGKYLGLSVLGEGSTVIRYSLGDVTANRCEGTVCHPNSFAMYLNTALPFAIALIFANVRRLYKILAVLVVGLGIVCLILTLSRGGWIGFLLSGSLVIILAIRRGRLKAVHAILVVCGVLLLAILVITSSNLIIDRLTTSDRGSAQSRITMDQGALVMMRDYPILGVGLNNYTLYMPQYDPITFAENHGLYVVHNTFLLIGAETGLIGLVGFVLFLLSIIFQAWNLTKISPNDFLWIIAVGVLCGYISLSVHNLVDFGLIGCSPVFFQFWFLAGIVVGFNLLITSSGQSKDMGIQSLNN
jgi:O-antigen ligase